MKECFARSIRSSQGRYRVEEDEDPKTEHEDDHGHVTVGQKGKKLQEEKFQKMKPSKGMMKLYYDEAKIMQKEPEKMATMSEVEPQHDARVNAHEARVIAQVQAFEAQVGEAQVHDMYKNDDQEDYHGTK